MDDTTTRREPPSARPGVGELVRRQRMLLAIAGGCALAALVGGAVLGSLPGGLFVAVGIALSVVNTLLTELSMVRMTAAAGDLSRKQFALSALGRLAVVSLSAIVLVIAFWPVGGLVLVGLAVFQLVTIVLTSLPLLKELRTS